MEWVREGRGEGGREGDAPWREEGSDASQDGAAAATAGTCPGGGLSSGADGGPAEGGGPARMGSKSEGGRERGSGPRFSPPSLVVQ